MNQVFSSEAAKEVNISIVGLTDIGRIRKSNQDAFIIADLIDHPFCFSTTWAKAARNFISFTKFRLKPIFYDKHNLQLKLEAIYFFMRKPYQYLAVVL